MHYGCKSVPPQCMVWWRAKNVPPHGRQLPEWCKMCIAAKAPTGARYAKPMQQLVHYDGEALLHFVPGCTSLASLFLSDVQQGLNVLHPGAACSTVVSYISLSCIASWPGECSVHCIGITNQQIHESGLSCQLVPAPCTRLKWFLLRAFGCPADAAAFS